MYALIYETGADFSRGSASKRIGHSLFATLPTLTFANRSMPVSPPGILAARAFIHRSDILCLAISHKAGIDYSAPLNMRGHARCCTWCSENTGVKPLMKARHARGMDALDSL
jgi:hypothetical protein